MFDVLGGSNSLILYFSLEHSPLQDQCYTNHMYFVPCCNIAVCFIQPFYCSNSPCSSNDQINWRYTTLHSHVFCMYFLQCCDKHKERCIVAHVVCIWCNILRTSRMGTMKRLFKTHSKIATMFKTHSIFVTEKRWICTTVFHPYINGYTREHAAKLCCKQIISHIYRPISKHLLAMLPSFTSCWSNTHHMT